MAARTRSRIIGVVSILLLGACGGSTSQSSSSGGDASDARGAGSCTPGDQKACACAGGGQGVQVCAQDGASYGACTGCGDAAGSTDTGPATDGGSDGPCSTCNEAGGEAGGDAEAGSPLDVGLVAYYPFSGNADDASGHGNNATVHGPALAPDRFGSPDSAYVFHGGSDYMDCGSGASLDLTAAFSVSVWIQYQSGQNIVGKEGYATGSTQRAGYYLWIDTARKVHFGFDGGASEVTSKSSVPVGSWTHIVGIADTALGTLRLRLNGALDSTITFSQQPVSTSAALWLGSSAAPWGPPVDVAAVLDEVRIYDRALSDAEADQL